MLSSALLRGRKAVLVRRGVPIALGGLVITGAGVAYADHGDSGPAYRTTTASVGAVDQLVTLTGTVAKLTQQDASFGVSGTVKKVEVAAGDKVSAGDTLATLDTTDLDAAVTAAKATLARAKAQLETDEAAHDSTSTNTTSAVSKATVTASAAPTTTGSSAPTGTGTGRPAGGAAGTTVGGVDLAAPTNAVVGALATATTDLQKGTAAITARDAACASVLSAADGATAAASPTAEPTATATEAPAVTDTTASTADLQSCIDAMTAVSDAQNLVATDQAAVQTTQSALSAAVDKAVAAIEAQASSAADTTPTATTTPAGGSRQPVNAVDQAAQLAVDNASITSAQAALDSANEDLDAAVLTAPIDGVVGTVGITKGSSAGTSNTITILGNGAVTVTLNVPQATAAKLQKGMAAKVTADGAAAPSDGTVESIGVLPSTSNGSSTYPVVVVVNNPADGLAEGAAATVAITLKAVDNAVTVPNSAVTATGSGATAYVTLIQNGKAVRQTVTTGAVGTTLTQIVSGVTAGQTVALADASADVPASSTTATTGGGGGNFTGGGNFPAGGGPGGGGTGNSQRN